jgi:hypothetical protein
VALGHQSSPSLFVRLLSLSHVAFPLLSFGVWPLFFRRFLSTLPLLSLRGPLSPPPAAAFSPPATSCPLAHVPQQPAIPRHPPRYSHGASLSVFRIIFSAAPGARCQSGLIREFSFSLVAVFTHRSNSTRPGNVTRRVRCPMSLCRRRRRADARPPHHRPPSMHSGIAFRENRFPRLADVCSLRLACLPRDALLQRRCPPRVRARGPSRPRPRPFLGCCISSGYTYRVARCCDHCKAPSLFSLSLPCLWHSFVRNDIPLVAVLVTNVSPDVSTNARRYIFRSLSLPCLWRSYFSERFPCRSAKSKRWSLPRFLWLFLFGRRLRSSMPSHPASYPPPPFP